MPRYMALIFTDAYPDHTPEEGAAITAEYMAFTEEVSAAGVMAVGEALQPPSTATSINVAGGKGGQVQILDAPYAEAKEILGGFYLLDCADLDEAIAWAAKIPGAWHPTSRVELIPVVDYSVR